RGVAAIRARTYQPYINWYVHFLQDDIYRLGTGSTFPNVTFNQLAAIPVPVPPVDEQQRIVSKVDELVTRLDAAVAALKRVQANLKRYRAAVLKAACEGRLVPTEAELARAEGRAYEPASVLLQRILAERRAQWE